MFRNWLALLLVPFASIVVAGFALAQAPSTRDRMSYAKVVFDPEYSKGMQLNESCMKHLQEIYSNGGSLSCKALQAVTQKVRDYKFVGTDNGKNSQFSFFHHTDVKAVTKIASESGTDRERINHLFEHMRECCGPPVLYVAADKKSSSQFGRRTIELLLNPDALIITPNSGAQASEDCTKELNQKYNNIVDHCGGLFLSSYSGSRFEYVVMEDSGVALIDYYDDQQWFQLVGPEQVEKLTVIRR